LRSPFAAGAVAWRVAPLTPWAKKNNPPPPAQQPADPLRLAPTASLRANIARHGRREAARLAGEAAWQAACEADAIAGNELPPETQAALKDAHAVDIGLQIKAAAAVSGVTNWWLFQCCLQSLANGLACFSISGLAPGASFFNVGLRFRGEPGLTFFKEGLANGKTLSLPWRPGQLKCSHERKAGPGKNPWRKTWPAQTGRRGNRKHPANLPPRYGKGGPEARQTASNLLFAARMNGGPVTHAEVSRRGGQAKSPAKLKAALANLQKAKAAQSEKRSRNKPRPVIA